MVQPRIPAQVEGWAKPFFADVQGQVGYVDGSVVHFWHGSVAKRRFGDRLQWLTRHGFDPALDLRASADGIWEWTGRNPDLGKPQSGSTSRCI